MATTFLETARCPQGHDFKIRRRISGAGFEVNTRCKVCGVQFAAPVSRPPERAVVESKHGQPTRESHIEARLVLRVKQMGGEVRKVSWQGRKGAPDRLVMLPPQTTRAPYEDAGYVERDRTIWVELKAPGKARTFPATAHERAQHREHERMRKMGQRVEVVDSYEQIEEMLK